MEFDIQTQRQCRGDFHMILNIFFQVEQNIFDILILNNVNEVKIEVIVKPPEPHVIGAR